MSEKFRTFDVSITVNKIVRVRVPMDEVVTNGDDPEEVAKEFAEGGKLTWPQWVVSEDEDIEVDQIDEVFDEPAKAA